MVKLLRYILFPFALLYGIIVAIRNLLFDFDVLKSSSFDVKTILVGNLVAGGTGKTPHIEYLIRLLGKNHKLATLSRGYGRKTTGFLLAEEPVGATEIGDEPLQFYSKFEDIQVAVCANRVPGVMELMSQEEASPEIILLDDAYQHRQLKAGLSILLMDVNSPFYRDFMLPTGNLREFAMGKKRADIIVVTKCAHSLSKEKKEEIKKKINTPDIPIFFSQIAYGNPLSLFDKEDTHFESKKSIVLVTGIANPKPLKEYITIFGKSLIHLNYLDHHAFSEKEIAAMIHKVESQPNACILTTEKDAMRLREFEELKKIPVYYLPIEIEIQENKEEFAELIQDYVRNN